MIIFFIASGVAAFLLIAALITAFVCFKRIFYGKRKQNTEEIPIPEGREYAPFREEMIKWMKDARALPHTDVEIRSHDGLTLRGKYYEYEKGAPLEILFHGYKGSSFRDLSGGIARCFSIGHNALIVDHRASGRSEGRVITFGVKESRDCLRWIDFAVKSIAPDGKIIITGISMGAATVMLASAEELPSNVIGVLADCGYTSAKEIIKKVIKEMGLPEDFLYPFARLGGMIYGGFDVNRADAEEALRRTKLPVIFFHGDTDDFVPHYMSVRNYEACASERKRLVTVKGAGHGLAYPCNKETYVSELKDFFG